MDVELVALHVVLGVLVAVGLVLGSVEMDGLGHGAPRPTLLSSLLPACLADLARPAALLTGAHPRWQYWW